MLDYIETGDRIERPFKRESLERGAGQRHTRDFRSD
jgi:hypothetical protein